MNIGSYTIPVYYARLKCMEDTLQIKIKIIINLLCLYAMEGSEDNRR